MSALTAGESFLKGILEAFRFVTASGSRTATVSLTGTSTALSSFRCKAVLILSNCTFVTGNGDSLVLTNPPILLPCNNANEIFVSGSGTLNYLILL